jgi:hypothetical protein
MLFSDLLSTALSLAHGLERAVPVEELEDGHELLELEHGLAQVLLQHEAVSSDPCPAVRITPRTLTRIITL